MRRALSVVAAVGASLALAAATPMGGEPVPGVEVALLRGERVVATAMTDQLGMFTFDGLAPGRYSVRLIHRDLATREAGSGLATGRRQHAPVAAPRDAASGMATGKRQATGSGDHSSGIATGQRQRPVSSGAGSDTGVTSSAARRTTFAVLLGGTGATRRMAVPDTLVRPDGWEWSVAVEVKRSGGRVEGQVTTN